VDGGQWMTLASTSWQDSGIAFRGMLPPDVFTHRSAQFDVPALHQLLAGPYIGVITSSGGNFV
jgi:hypothetical protein